MKMKPKYLISILTALNIELIFYVSGVDILTRSPEAGAALAFASVIFLAGILYPDD